MAQPAKARCEISAISSLELSLKISLTSCETVNKIKFLAEDDSMSK